MVSALTHAVVVLVTVVGLWVGARLLVDSAVRLARGFGLSDLAIGVTVVAVGTSTPELIVTSGAALSGLGDIAVSNVLGSNIYNLAFILGVVSLLRVIPIERSLVHRDGVALVAATLLGGATLLDLTVTRIEGVVLVAALVAYTTFLLRAETDLASDSNTDSTTTGADSEATGTDSTVAGIATEDTEFRRRDGLALVAGLAIVLLSGHFMVEAASTLARAAGISEWVIGGTIVAAGTSTPEFAVSLVAMRRGSVGVSVGNVVGSDIFNLLGVMGFGAVLRPLSVSPSALESVAWLTVVVVVVVAALWSGRKLSQLEGGLLASSEVLRWVLGLLGIVG